MTEPVEHLRDFFAASLRDEMNDFTDAVKEEVVGRSIAAGCTALEALQFEADFRAKWRYMQADAMLNARG